MKRIVMLVVVTLVMAAMIAVMAVPAFAVGQGWFCGKFISSEGQEGRVGIVVRDEAGPALGPEISGDCSPR